MAEEWFIEKLENLKVDDVRLTILSEIRTKLNERPNIETAITNRLLNAPEIYDCLRDAKSTTTGEQFNIVNDILSICMSNISITQSDFPQLLHRALRHPRSRIRALALNTVLKELQQHNVNNTEEIVMSNELLNLILEALYIKDEECGIPAMTILKIVLQQKVNYPGIQEKLLTLLKDHEIVKCRVYELAIHLAKQSPPMLESVRFLLDHAIAELDYDDVLFQLNVLELFVDLCEVNHGLQYLEEKQVFDVLSARIEQIETNPIDRLLVPGIIKFFGKTGSYQPQKIIICYPFVIKSIFECFATEDLNMLPVALDTFANLATTQQGKLLLDANYDVDVKQTLEMIASFLKNANTEQKKHIFQSMIVVFSCIDGEAMPDVSAVLQKWFCYFVGNVHMGLLTDYCRNPFPDIKVSCLNFIHTLCSYDWGILAVKNTAGFVEFLLDRKIEFDKEAKYAKYEVIQRLAASAVFDVQTSLQLRTYVNEGPYFVEVQMEVAVEGN